MREPAGEGVNLTRRRGDAEKNAEKEQESQNLRTQRKRRDLGWRHQPLTQVGACFGAQILPSTVTYASLRSPWISAVSGLDFLDSVLRVFLRVSASPRQTDGLFGPGFAGLRSGSR